METLRIRAQSGRRLKTCFEPPVSPGWYIVTQRSGSGLQRVGTVTFTAGDAVGGILKPCPHCVQTHSIQKSLRSLEMSWKQIMEICCQQSVRAEGHMHTWREFSCLVGGWTRVEKLDKLYWHRRPLNSTFSYFMAGPFALHIKHLRIHIHVTWHYILDQSRGESLISDKNSTKWISENWGSYHEINIQIYNKIKKSFPSFFLRFCTIPMWVIKAAS